MEFTKCLFLFLGLSFHEALVLVAADIELTKCLFPLRFPLRLIITIFDHRIYSWII